MSKSQSSAFPVSEAVFSEEKAPFLPLLALLEYIPTFGSYHAQTPSRDGASLGSRCRGMMGFQHFYPPKSLFGKCTQSSARLTNGRGNEPQEASSQSQR